MADYERYLPDHERDFRRRSTLAQMLHLDLLLLTPLLVLMFGGLSFFTAVPTPVGIR